MGLGLCRHSTSNDIHADWARARDRARAGAQGRQEIQGKRRIPNGDKLLLIHQSTKKIC